jgi:hypothetical protein
MIPPPPRDDKQRPERFVDTSSTEHFHFDEATEEAAKEFSDLDAIDRYIEDLAEQEEQDD